MVFLVAAFALGLLTVPLAGGSLRHLGALELRRPRVLAFAFVLQLVALKAPIPKELATPLNLSTYLLGAWYLLANVSLPGMWLVAVGAASNVLALLANGGVMPASPKALAAAGLSSGSGESFVNSAVVPDAQVAFLGDIFAIPHSFPLHNVFSIGDVLILLGALVAAHRLCGSRLFPGAAPSSASSGRTATSWRGGPRRGRRTSATGSTRWRSSPASGKTPPRASSPRC